MPPGLRLLRAIIMHNETNENGYDSVLILENVDGYLRTYECNKNTIEELEPLEALKRAASCSAETN